MQENQNTIPFQIVGVELLDFEMSSPKEQLPQNTMFQYDINLQHRLNLENNLVIVICSVSIFFESKNQMMGKIRSSCIFSVEELNDYVDEVTKSMTFPKEFIDKINGETISTARGIMFSQFRGTYLHNAVLPAIDAGNFGKGPRTK